MFNDRDYFSISTTPCDESCAQVGQSDYYEKTRMEAKVFIKMIERLFPEQVQAEGFSMGLKSFPHDFGTYHEVCLYFYVSTETDEEGEYILTPSEEAAIHIENNLPFQWEEEDLRELHRLGYFKPRMELVQGGAGKEKVLKKA